MMKCTINKMHAAMLAALALSALSTRTAYAQAAGTDSSAEDTAAFEDALFSDEPDAGAAAIFDTGTALAGSGDVARTEYLVGGTIVAQATGNFTMALDSLTAVSTIAGKVFAKVSVPDYGALYIAYNASHALFQAYTGSGTALDAKDPYAPDYELAELHYSFDVAKVLFVRAGNQLIAWGPSRIWSPVDFINLEKEDAFSSIDLRVGKPGLRLHMPLRKSNVFLFADFANLVTGAAGDLKYGDPLESVNLGGRYDFTAGPFEFGITGYGGQNAQARFGLDASGRLLGTTVYGELAMKPAYSSYDSSAQMSLGFSRTLDELKKWSLSAEGFYNSLGEALTPLYQGNWYTYAALSADDLFSPSLSTTLSVITNLSDLSYSVKLAESFSFARAVPFTLSLSFAGGGEDKEFTRYAGDNAFTISVSTRVEF
jgi:hypothetical protein